MSDEPEYVRYNRQVGQSVYLFWLVEAGDIPLLMTALSINMVTVESVWLTLWMIVGFVIYLVSFRAGRPRGYDRHFFGHMLAKTFMRPGKSNAAWPIRD